MFLPVRSSISFTGAYTCTFMSSSLHKKWFFKATNNITVVPINIVQSGDIEVVCDNSEVLLSCCIDGNIQSFTINWRPDEAINIPGKTEKNQSHVPWASFFLISPPNLQLKRGTCSCFTDKRARFLGTPQMLVAHFQGCCAKPR